MAIAASHNEIIDYISQPARKTTMKPLLDMLRAAWLKLVWPLVLLLILVPPLLVVGAIAYSGGGLTNKAHNIIEVKGMGEERMLLSKVQRYCFPAFGIEYLSGLDEQTCNLWLHQYVEAASSDFGLSEVPRVQ